MNTYIIIGIIGIISGILCSLADVPLGSTRVKKSERMPTKTKYVHWWGDVPERNFSIAFWLSCIGQPGTYLTMWMLGVLIAKNNALLGTALKINTFIGAYTGLLFHATLCIKPLVYQKIHKKLSEEEINSTLSAIEQLPKIPSVLSGISLFFATSVIVAVAILTGALDVPTYLIFFNPIVVSIVLFALRKAKFKTPGPLGAGFILLAIVLVVAGVGM